MTETEESVKMEIRASLMEYAFGPKKSMTAKITLESMDHADKAEVLMKNYKEGYGDEDLIIIHLADSLKHAFSICAYGDVNANRQVDRVKPYLAKVLKKIGKNGAEKSDLDKSARMVNIFIYYHFYQNWSKISTSADKSLVYIEECIQKYPDEIFFYKGKSDMLHQLLCIKKGVEEVRYQFVQEIVANFPNDINILFDHFNSLFFLYLSKAKAANYNFKPELVMEKLNRLEDLLNNFLAVAPPDHPSIPAMYFHLGLFTLFYVRNDITSFSKNEKFKVNEPIFLKLKKYYEKKLEEEKGQVPYHTGTGALTFYEDGTLNMIKNLLKSASNILPKTLDIVKTHRANLKLKAHKGAQNNLNSKFKKKCNLNETATFGNAELLDGLNKIDLSDLNLDIKKEHIYEGNYIELIIVEDPYIADDIIMLVGKEEYLVYRIAIRNFDKNIEQFLGFGFKIIITHPHLKIEEGGKCMIEVNDPKTLILSAEKDLKRCRWCGDSNSVFSCAKCGRKYCKKECQLNDWKSYNHKLICRQPTNELYA